MGDCMFDLRKAALLLAAAFLLSACLPAQLRAVSDSVSGAPATPDPLAAFEGDAPVLSAADWTERRAPILRAQFVEKIFGDVADLGATEVRARTPLTLPPLSDSAAVEQWTIALGAGAEAPAFNLLLVAPKSPGPHPLIVLQLFCGNRAALEGRPESVAGPLTPVMYPCENGWTDPIAQAVFGRHINGPPFADLVARGYALATFYPGDVAADDAALGPSALAPFKANGADTGAIAVWASLYSRALDALEADPRIDASRTIVWGHSRHGKSALLAAALDPRIDGVISHQSGRGGAALNRSDIGEPIGEMLANYPHWFPPVFAEAASAPIDQHLLIALIAPRPVLIGAASRDSWSDPHGQFRAAKGADPVYRLFGGPGLAQETMRAPRYESDLVFFLRDGTHGVTREDWRHFNAFLDAHFSDVRTVGAP